MSSGGRKDEDRGAAAEVRTLLFRLCRLSRLPFSILFIFDGRCRPKEKRGSRMGKSGTHFLALPFQKLISMFGMDWREVSVMVRFEGKPRLTSYCRPKGRPRLSSVASITSATLTLSSRTTPTLSSLVHACSLGSASLALVYLPVDPELFAV